MSGSVAESVPTGEPVGWFSATVVADRARPAGASLTSVTVIANVLVIVPPFWSSAAIRTE